MNQTELKLSKRNIPKFTRYRSKNIKKLKRSWRRPKGLHNKLRLRFRGYGKLPSIGYGSNKKIKGQYLGFRPVIIKNLEDLKEIKSKEILISSKVGLRKKISILNKAKELKLNVLNIKNVDEFLKKVEENLKKRKQKTKKQEKEKAAKEEKKEEKKEVAKKKETKEEKEKREKLEKKKVLEDKQAIRRGGTV